MAGRSDASTPYLTISVAAAALGMRGKGAPRRLKRQLLARERALGTAILVRRGGARQTRYLVTMTLLRLYCPELFARRDAVVERVREHVAETADRLDELQARDELLAKEVRGLKEGIAQCLRALFGASQGDQKRPRPTNLATYG